MHNESAKRACAFRVHSWLETHNKKAALRAASVWTELDFLKMPRLELSAALLSPATPV
jgi:hypothetical protein